MFLVHHVPSARNENRTWVNDPEPDKSINSPYIDGPNSLLMMRRLNLPLNGETAFADTAAAFENLPEFRQAELRNVVLRRRLNVNDPGFLTPLVRKNPRSGIESLHSPIWASRPGARPPVEVEGMSEAESREFLDELETHVLHDDFPYDHIHQQGAITIWDNYMTLHNSPPMKVRIREIEDARLLYRLGCKGNPSLSLPRRDNKAWLVAHVTGYSEETSTQPKR